MFYYFRSVVLCGALCSIVEDITVPLFGTDIFEKNILTYSDYCDSLTSDDRDSLEVYI